MKAYKVIAKDGDKVLGFRFAGTQADARSTREELMSTFDVKKKDVLIEDTEIPTQKVGLLEFANELAEKQDAKDED